MALSIKLKKLPFVLLCALGSLGANTATTRCDLYCGKFVRDQALPFKLDYYDTDYPSFSYCWSVYQDKTKTSLVTTSGYTFKSLDTTASDPHFIYEATVPSNALSGLSSYCFEMKISSSKGPYYATTAKTYIFTIESGDLLSSNISLTNPEKGKVYETSRKYSTHKGGVIGGGLDSYYIASVPIQDNNYHGIRVTNYGIGYHDASSSSMKKGTAKLYIYTEPFEWNIGTVGYSEGKFYRIITMDMYYVYSKTVSGVAYSVFIPQLKEDYAVDRYDSRMYEASKRQEDPTRYFLTRDIFLPIRNGKETKTYSFGLKIFGLDEYGDTIQFNFSVTKNSAFFGSCTDADYCVGLGD